MRNDRVGVDQLSSNLFNERRRDRAGDPPGYSTWKHAGTTDNVAAQVLLSRSSDNPNAAPRSRESIEFLRCNIKERTALTKSRPKFPQIVVSACSVNRLA